MVEEYISDLLSALSAVYTTLHSATLQHARHWRPRACMQYIKLPVYKHDTEQPPQVQRNKPCHGWVFPDPNTLLENSLQNITK
jgi:hypothetical protein